MTARVILIGTLWVLGLEAAKLPEWYTRELPDAEIQARLVQDLAEIERVAGDTLEGEVILVELRVRPLYGSAVTLDRDQFLLRARNNNDMSRARTPDRIGGGAVLALVSERVGAPVGVMSEQANAPIWTGAPGTSGRPQRLGGPPNVLGGGDSHKTEQSVEGRYDDDQSVVARLRARELPLQTRDTPVSGYLYFEIPAKVKRKHLELSYDGTLGELLIEFKKAE